jgi:hypothetical protein
MSVVSVGFVKKMGWDFIALGTKGFDGAVQSYPTNAGGNVALCFGHTDVFFVKDEDDGYVFTAKDLENGVIKSKDFSVHSPGQIEGAKVIAWEDEGVVTFDDEQLTALGLNDFTVKESIKNRLLSLATLGALKDIQL